MRPARQALIIAAVAAITIGSVLAVRHFRHPEQDMVAQQIEMVFHSPVQWHSFTKTGTLGDIEGGYGEFWKADFTVAGRRMQITFLAFHDGDRIRIQPLG